MASNSGVSNKSYININNKYDRVVVLIDMDCFYCQVEEKLNPSLKGKPLAVVQYNAWKGGGIIAVNYPARDQGVTRHMRGDEAKKQCPDIELCKVPSIREKADLTKYRDAGKEVAIVLQSFTNLLERASVDEAYLDITEEVNRRLTAMDQGNSQIKPEELFNTYAVGYDHIGQYVQEITERIQDEIDESDFDEENSMAAYKSNLKLLIGASIVNEIRMKVKEKTGYECSAGIAHNKILAKLVCGINKPNKQTILPLKQIDALFSTLPIGKIKGLGGKFGEDVCESLNVKYLGDLLSYSEKELQKNFDEKNGTWLYLISRGIDLEAVTSRFYSKSIGCCKKFPGRNSITGLATLKHWFTELANEIRERLENDLIENNRQAKQMVVSFTQEINGEDVSSSRSTNLSCYEADNMAQNALEVLRKSTDQMFKASSENILNNPIKFLGISVGKFEPIAKQQNILKKMFLNHKKEEPEKKSIEEVIINNPCSSETNEKYKNSFFINRLEKKSIKLKTLNEDKEIMQIEPRSVQIKTGALHLFSDIENNCTDKTEEKEIPKFDTVYTVEDSNNVQESENIHESVEPSFLSTNYEMNYINNYAECQIPETSAENFIICDQCNKKVLVYDLQSHNDFHYAFELSQQQRQEFRNEFKSKLKNKRTKTSPPATNHRNKIRATNEKLIDNFFPKVTEEMNEEQNKKCSECGLWVEDLVEHADFHLAKTVQNEMRRKSIHSSSSKTQSPASRAPKISGNRKGNLMKSKSISTFFSQSQS